MFMSSRKSEGLRRRASVARNKLPRIASCRACPRPAETHSRFCLDCNSLPEAERNRKAAAFYQKHFRKCLPEFVTKTKLDYRHALRREGIAAYGGKCACCGETEFDFLTLEHEQPPPKAKSGRRLTGAKAWAPLKAAGWPAGHTVLCFNCNCAKGAYGSCPHTRKQA